MRAFLLAAVIASVFLFGCIILKESVPAPAPVPQPQPQPVPKACTGEAKLCPDGSAVGRNADRNCEFDPCPVPQLVGNDSDEHGCKGSAGYSWCEELQECIRPWETNCTSTDELEARNYCRQGSVYICGDYAKVMRPDIAGGPTRFYKLGTNISYECPIIAPDYMTPACRELTLTLKCNETAIC